MDFVIHRRRDRFRVQRGAVVIWCWRDGARPMRHSAVADGAVRAGGAPGAVGLDQYETHLPAELVGCTSGWPAAPGAALWATARRVAGAAWEPYSADRRLKGDLGAPTPVKFPGN